LKQKESCPLCKQGLSRQDLEGESNEAEENEEANDDGVGVEL